MACALTQGYSKGDCRDNMGGSQEWYAIEWDNIESVTKTAGVVTGITKATGARFWKYQQVKETSYGKSTITANEANGSIYYAQEVGIVLNKMQTAVRNEIILLGQNHVVWVGKDNNGKFWMYGLETGLLLNSGEMGTGTAMGDRNGTNLVFTGAEKEPAIEVDAATAAALETPGT